jgi:hypothetical protein
MSTVTYALEMCDSTTEELTPNNNSLTSIIEQLELINILNYQAYVCLSDYLLVG